MRDRVRLATDVYLPQGATEGLCAVLVRLPYDKNSRYVFMETIAGRLTDRGYAVVIQDVRGKYRSEGNPLGPTNEVNDGHDTIDWIVRQDWSNQRVGMFGDSYYGFTQWAAVASEHPALCAIVPRVTSVDLMANKPVEHGTVIDVPWLTELKYHAQCWAGPYVWTDEPDWEIAPITDIFEKYFATTGARSQWYDLMIPTSVPLPVFPAKDPFAARPVPTLHCVGWYDNLANYSMRDYVRFASQASTSPFHYLWVDSIDHENYHLTQVPVQPEDDHGVSDEALQRLMISYLDPAIDFLDIFLLRTAPLASVSKVQWHLGNVGWQTADQWPPKGAQQVDFYLTELSKAANEGGVLTRSHPADADSTQWAYDPDNLVRSTVTNSFAYLWENPDEREWVEHPDVLTFETPVLTEAIDLAGPVDLFVRVDSTAPTTDVYARLCVRHEDGRIMQISRGQGILRAPSRDDVVRIEVGHTGYRLQPGQRLHLQIASSDYPEFPPNSGTSESRWTAAQRKSSIQDLHTDDAQPARVRVTIASASEG
ncbi:hypothetical protein ASG95_20490 [Phycicoccus sp. Soil803]|nr:hypothetical protein ASG95_20490 [Phycicoccus sp. Soil803]